MSLETKYSDPQGIEQPAVMVSLGSNIRFGDFGITMSAAGGETSISSFGVDDPGGIYDFVGLRAFEVRESSAASNNQVIGRFVVQDREVGRDEERAFLTGKDRLWSFEITDYNWHLGKRILVDSDANRPAETSGDRIRWLLNNAAHINLNDYGHVTYPSAQMDANDYRGMRAADVLVDCAIEEQYNFWARYNEAHGKPELFFLNPNGSSYASTVAISNLIGDVDSVTTFAPYRDAKLRRSPTRIAYGVYLAYNGGAVYVRKQSTGDQFGPQDQTAPSGTIHTAAKATRVATAFLNANDSENDEITVSIKVPAAQVNDIIEGQRLAVKFSHLPGYETGRWTRVTQRSVIQDEEGGGQYYRLDLTLIPSGGAGTVPTIPPGNYPGSAFAGLQNSNYDQTTLGFVTYGDAPYPGWNANPNVGPLSVVGGPAPYISLRADHDIVVRVYALAFFSTVAISATATMNITSSVSGLLFQDTKSFTHASPGGFWSDSCLIDEHNVSLVSGEILTVSGSYTGFLTGGWGGVGINNSSFRIGRGTQNWGSGGAAEVWVGP